MIIYIKNMVCPRCIQAVRHIIENEGLTILYIELGKVMIAENNVSKRSLYHISNSLTETGFEILNDEQHQTIEQIKTIIIDVVHYKQPAVNISNLLIKQLNRDYSYLSKLFSQTEGITIEQYSILQKVEYVKELLSYNQLTLSEIAFQLNYSSVAHLSAQFKKVTGMTPTQFKNQKERQRKPLDNLS